MSDDLAAKWRRETLRLQEARQRFLDSLTAIRELADFATEHVVKLDEKRTSAITIRFSGSMPEASADSPSGDAFVDALKAVFGRHSSKDSDGHESGREDDKSEHDGIDILEAINEAIVEFKESLPEGVDKDSLKEAVMVERPRARTDLLLASLLIAAVSDFEVLFSAAVNFFYRMRPEALKAQESKIAWSEIEQYASLEDIRSHFIDERVSQLMWTGFDDWMKWIAGQLKIKFEDVSLDPSDTTEVFQRRHIIVHNGGSVSAQYLAKVPKARGEVAIGMPLPVSGEYLEAALDKLTVLGVSLTFLVFCKLCPSDSEHVGVERDVLSVIFDLLSVNRWEAVGKVCSIALPEVKRGYEFNAVRVNGWIAQKHLKGLEAIASDVTAWDISALQRVFELAQKALLDDPSAVDLAVDLARSGELGQQEIDTWPLLDEIKDKIIERMSSAERKSAELNGHLGADNID